MKKVVVNPQKAIRFAASYEGPSKSKKRRITAACGTCRRRKTKCDGERPECLACQENGNVCLGYETVEKSRNTAGDEESGNPANWNYGKAEEEASHQQVRVRMGPETKKSSCGQDPTFKNPQRYESSIIMPNYEHATVGDSDSESVLQRGGRSIPYFRYFGPTAIVPGFKQMVVQVKDHKKSVGSASVISVASPRRTISSDGSLELRNAANIPLYNPDPEDSAPLHPLIKHLVETFFIHLGCNFPFLERDRFFNRLEEKKVETILVDAICALAARFSTHPLLAIPKSSEIGHELDELRYPKSDYGIVFAQRARVAVIDSFPCPTIVSVQACLLLAYEGFGTNQDSALWMYLGCAIRMAQDLGLQKQEGIKHLVQQEMERTCAQNESTEDPGPIATQETLKEEKSLERSYLNTYWAVLMLDRVISSGTGRPVSLREQDMDVAFPPYAYDSQSGWPVPFPALIRVIHIFGRVSDLLNSIRRPEDLSPEAVKRLDEMERDLTTLYQKLDSRLTFHVVNFQHHAKAGQGTNFILLHFWFHALIIILHQPQLLHSFEGSIQELFPNSHELSTSSANTIADILAFAELTDARSFVNNPFTSQPMYIAASAFLMEIRAQSGSHSGSRAQSPIPRGENSSSGAHKSARKYGLLASAATEKYQRCYKALHQLERYWAGTKYILTALDQKAKGMWDKESLETYTAQEMEHAKRRKYFLSRTSGTAESNHSNSSPSSQRRNEFSHSERAKEYEAENAAPGYGMRQFPAMNDFGNGQIWTLNGTTNSRNANLTSLRPNTNTDGHGSRLSPNPPREFDSTTPNSRIVSNSFGPSLSTPSPSGSLVNSEWAIISGQSLVPTPRQDQNGFLNLSPYAVPTESYFDFFQNGHAAGIGGDMMIESQDIDIPLEGDMMNWLEYLPRDVLGGGEDISDGEGGIV